MKELSEVEAGDQVVMQYRNRFGEQSGYLLLKVHHTTKTKIVVTSGAREIDFSRDGTEKVARRGFGSSFRELLVANDENLALVERHKKEQAQKRALNDLRDLVRGELTPEQVQAALAAIGDATEVDV